MADGVTISQQGIPVSEALDAQKVLDSRWLYFEIAYEQRISLDTVPSVSIFNYDIFSHKLGFVPAFDIYNITRDEYMSSGVVANSEKVYFNGPPADNTDYSSTEVLLRVYDVPILEEYEAPISVTLPSKTVVPSKYGVKITENNDFKIQELTKYTLNTKGKALAIQRTGTETADSNNKIIIEHKLGFPPTYLAAEVASDKSYVNALNPSFVPVKSSANTRNLTFTGVQAALTGTWAYIIFKEPAEVAV